VTTYYLIDGRNISLREYRRLTPNLLVFLLVALLKLFRFPLTNGALVPLVDRVHELDWDDLPAEAHDALAEPVAAWERLGFRRAFVCRLPNPQKNRFLAAAVLLSPDRTAHAHVTYVRRPDGRFTWSNVYSLFADGTLGLTTNQKHELDDPPTVLRSQQPVGAPAADLWEAHRDNLTGPWAEYGAERLDAAGVRAVTVEIERREVEFHAARGVLVPATDADYERLADPD
jgi:hypothetical protein